MKVIMKTILAIIIATFVIALLIRELPDVKEVTQFGEKFERIQIGDKETKAISFLGKPDAKEKKFRLGQEIGFEDAYARAEASNSEYYLLWFRGIDVVFSLGINSKGEICVKELGGT